jgi:hypothetical protein
MENFKSLKYILIILIIITIASCKPEKKVYIINVRENIHHDDFEYSVSNYIMTRFLKNGPDTLYARGVFYLVIFKVENRARRVNHKWNNSIGYIIDERGKTYENISEVQEFWEKAHPFGLKNEYVTGAGSSDSTYLAFDLPFNVTKPCLGVRGDILMGDTFDRAKFRRTLVKLF